VCAAIPTGELPFISEEVFELLGTLLDVVPRRKLLPDVVVPDERGRGTGPPL
jgi:hypothetical protein